MTSITPDITLSTRDYDAVLFDLDGLLTEQFMVPKRRGSNCRN
jgi:hypothetical protein